MPEPGLSPLQSSLPIAAARFGAHLATPVPDTGDPSATAPPAASPHLPGPPAPPALPLHPVVPAAATASMSAPGVSAPVDGPTTDLTSCQAKPVETELAGVLERVLRGPSGLGTAGLSLSLREAPPAPGATATGDPVEGRPIPGLYFHPVAEPDPVRVAEVGRRVRQWAVEEVRAVPEEWEDQFDGFSVSRYMVACHPDAPTVEHLMLAARLMVAENAVDDCYCEDHGGSPVGLGSRLLLAHTALDPLHTTKEYEGSWARSLEEDAPRRAYRSAMEYFANAATASQADRFRHDMARLHLGYLAEAAWAQDGHVPQVWEYLAMRQFNNFRPCPTITDTVGGYELPADLHAQGAMQRVIALAGNATTIVNDLYSYTKELAGPGLHLNLPVVIAERECLTEREAYLKAVEVHNDLMHAFEAEAAALAAACPVPSVLRFLRGVAVWVDGNHYWHQTNTYRYSLPDFW
ncbi:2-methylisoborneol synthase [Streptomyces sp. Je 1-79]|uniref:family 2 encapsulin nanocompartment cargo protein terpene cyclase n=1 Tax=Streptomyces sp. Je 1-79 TaxID=2943847 RepID=UPI0021A343BE|nr:family 2 encapsulin nanocompartment cargo protein terpene cyclase [Streptomyces sp. Je 1-79]MCT4357829.1 2-methylisoborneol synthase [Streptomyces sp. Je 1-79]